MFRFRSALVGLASLTLALGPASGPLAADPSPSTAQPAPPPPQVEGVSEAPPPAWIETSRGGRWLAYSTFCWTTACVDFVPPSMRDDLPRVVVRRGEVVRFHLGFEPRSLSVRVGSRLFRLRPARTSSWRAVSGGLLLLEAEHARGDASYVARVRVR